MVVLIRPYSSNSSSWDFKMILSQCFALLCLWCIFHIHHEACLLSKNIQNISVCWYYSCCDNLTAVCPRYFLTCQRTRTLFDTHMAGDDSGLGVCCQWDDSVSGLSQDRAGFLTTQNPLGRERKTERGQSLHRVHKGKIYLSLRWSTAVGGAEKYFLRHNSLTIKTQFISEKCKCGTLNISHLNRRC